jgi:hypothetical protein
MGRQSGGPSPSRAAAIASVRTMTLESRNPVRTSAARSVGDSAPLPRSVMRRDSSSRSLMARTAVALSSPSAAARVRSASRRTIVSGEAIAASRSSATDPASRFPVALRDRARV